MKIAACQLPHVQNDVDRALSLIRLHTTAARRQGADLICFPECFLQGYDVRREHVADTALDLSSPGFNRVLHHLQDLEPVIVLGLIEKEGGRFYNTAVALERGRPVARYRKAHLIGNENAIFERGDRSPVFSVGGVTVGINICHDLQFAESLESAVRAGAALLACPCNNMLRPENAELWKERHNAIRCERAREAGVWIVSSDVAGEHNGRISYGPTAAIDASGRVVAQVPLMTTGIITVDFPPVPADTPAPPRAER